MTYSPEATERLANAMSATAWVLLPVFALIAAGGALEVYPSVMLITRALGNDGGGDISLAVMATVAFVAVLLGAGITTHLLLRGFAHLLLTVRHVEENASS